MSFPTWLVTLGPLILASAAKYGVNPALIAGVIAQESGGNSAAQSTPRDPNGNLYINADGSVRHDNGLMQVSNGSFDPATNIDQGTAYLAQQLQSFGNSQDLALAAYNAGPGNVQQAGNTVPSFAQGYVNSVDSFFNAFSSFFQPGPSGWELAYLPGTQTPAPPNPITEGGQTPPPPNAPTSGPFGGVIDALNNAVQVFNGGVNTVNSGVNAISTAANDVNSLAAFLGQPNLILRGVIGIVGGLLVIVGLILFALSFLPSNTASNVITFVKSKRLPQPATIVEDTAAV
jgi:Transglycosylase SLT domain